jgi:hypothetical protein
MSLKTYSVTLGSAGGATREVQVVSPTDVQAGDAARPLMSEGESILEIRETLDDPRTIDAGPPVSQAAELASVTPGAAAAPDPQRG